MELNEISFKISFEMSFEMSRSILQLVALYYSRYSNHCAIIEGTQPWTGPRIAHLILTILSCDHIVFYMILVFLEMLKRSVCLVCLTKSQFTRPTRCHTNNLRKLFLRFLHYSIIIQILSIYRNPRSTWIPSVGASVCRGTRLIALDI
jgi:hypothetical protein